MGQAADRQVLDPSFRVGPGHFESQAAGFAESRTVAPGSQPVVVDLDGTKIGMTTCYDVRFPGLYTTLADRGASSIDPAAVEQARQAVPVLANRRF